MAEQVSQVEYRRLGNSGLRVSVPIVGGAAFGSSKWLPWVLDEEQALPILKAAWDRGLNTWDTSNSYSNGESERIIGKAIQMYNIPRERVVLLTKCFNLVADDVFTRTNFGMWSQPEYVNQCGLSRTAIFNQVEGSLKRLNTTYIDLLQIHRADLANVNAEETMKALHDLVQSGKVRYIGASCMWTWQLQLYNNVAEKYGWTQFVSMENTYSLLYREEEREMIQYCHFAGIGLIPWGALHQGCLARPLQAPSTVRSEVQKKVLRPSDEEVLKRVELMAKNKGWSMSQVALAWINGKVTSPVVGFSSVKRIEEAIIPGYVLTEDEKSYLEEPYEPQQVVGHV